MLQRQVESWTKKVRKHLAVGAALVASAMTWSRDTEASGFANARFASEHGNVTTTNPTALYFNPAGIAFSDGTHLMVDASFMLRFATWTHAQSATDVPEPPGARGANYGEAKAFNMGGGPMAGLTLTLERLALGVFYGAPFGGRTKWDPNESFRYSTSFPGAIDGVARWHAIEAEQVVAYFTAGVAYRIGPLAVGVSGNLIRSDSYLYRAQNPLAGDNDITHEGRTELIAGGWNGSFGVGVMLEVVHERLFLGASYQARPGLGEMTLDGTRTTTYPLGTSAPSPSVTRDVSLHQGLPDIVRLGARWRATSAFELRVSADVTRWSAMQRQCITLRGYDCPLDAGGAAARGAGVLESVRRGWLDTVGLHAGASYWLSPQAEAFAGVGFETYAVPDATLDPGLRDADAIALTVGARFQVVRTLFVAGSLTTLQYLARDNRGKSDLSPSSPDPELRSPDGGGRYTQWALIPNVNLEKVF